MNQRYDTFQTDGALGKSLATVVGFLKLSQVWETSDSYGWTESKNRESCLRYHPRNLRNNMRNNIAFWPFSWNAQTNKTSIESG